MPHDHFNLAIFQRADLMSWPGPISFNQLSTTSFAVARIGSSYFDSFVSFFPHRNNNKCLKKKSQTKTKNMWLPFGCTCTQHRSGTSAPALKVRVATNSHTHTHLVTALECRNGSFGSCAVPRQMSL